MRNRFEEAADAPGDLPGEDGGADSLATAGDRIEPFYAKAGRGRRPYPLGVMLRVHCVQLFYNLSDHGGSALRGGVGAPLCGSAPERSFAGRDDDPGHLLETQGLGMGLFEEINVHLASLGHRLKTGTIVDASIIDAPSSTKNRRGERDPEMHQTKKGNQWYFGMKAHIGVDAESGLAHSLATTAANAADVTQAWCCCIETEAWGDGATRVWTSARRTGVAWQVAMKRASVACSIGTAPRRRPTQGIGAGEGGAFLYVKPLRVR